MRAPAPASRAPLAIAGALLAVLLATAGRYGYHRDEMYFIVTGRHPSFGYPDQPPLVPLLAASMDRLAPGSLIVLRLPGALAVTATVLISAAAAAELGCGRAGRTIAATCTATASILLVTGHFVSTTTFDMLSTSLFGLLLIRALVRHRAAPLLWAGIVVGVGSEAKPQVAFVALLAVVALLLVGPRWPFRSWQLWAGAASAAVLAAPYLIWQAGHGWPQVTVAGAVAGTAMGGRVGFVPFQFLLVSPVFVPVWVAGLVSAWRRPPLRWLTVTYVLALATYVAGDGKGYYLASLYPVLLAAGAGPTVGWLARGAGRARGRIFAACVALTIVLNFLIALPLLPAHDLAGSPIIAVNPDQAETIGWPEFASTVAQVWSALPAGRGADAAILTRNYGEAGAVDLLGLGDGLPEAYSGHNGLWYLGPPPDSVRTLVVVGFDDHALPAGLGSCRVVARITNRAGVDNQEAGGAVQVCGPRTEGWPVLWPRLRHDN